MICDTHLHIFGDRRKYPLESELRSEPPDAPLERFLQVAGAEGVTRMVFDQPSHYGLDNSCILDAIAAVGSDRARAVAAVDADTVTDAALEARIVWGSDWPFLSHLDAVTYPQLLRLFESWVPDAATRRKILVENPTKLFGF